jgi:hypothetical protein
MVEARQLLVDDEGNAELFTGIASQANETSKAMPERSWVRAETLEIRNGGEVASSSFAGGRAGDVEVRAAQVVVRDGGVIASSRRDTDLPRTLTLRAMYS